MREEKEGKLQILLSPRENGVDSPFKKVGVFRGGVPEWPPKNKSFLNSQNIILNFSGTSMTAANQGGPVDLKREKAMGGGDGQEQ